MSRVITLATLAKEGVWVAWQAEATKGRDPTKVPYGPAKVAGFETEPQKAKANNPKTWGTRAQVEEVLKKLPKPFGQGGVGLEFKDHPGEGWSLGGIDLDTCRNPETEVIEPWAMEVIERFNTYTEISPSGTGVKLFFIYTTADLPAFQEAMGGAKFGKQFKRGNGKHPAAIEPHLGNRYFAVTEQHFPGTPIEFRHVDAEDVLWLLKEAGPAFVGKPVNGTQSITDDGPVIFEDNADDLMTRLKRAMMFRPNLHRRWTGDPSGLQDASRSGRDMSLTHLLRQAGFSYQETKSILIDHYRFGAGAEKVNDDRYFQRMWAKAEASGTNEKPSAQAKEPDTRPIIQYAAGKVDTLTDQAEQALLDAGADVFTRAGRLVRPGYADVQAADGRTTKAGGFYTLENAALIEELNRVAKWQKFDGRSNGWRTINPPDIIVRVLADRKGRWKLRSVAGVITCPTMRPDGTMLSEPGYDPATRLYLMPDPDFRLPSIPERPNREAAGDALKLLSSLLAEFPFVAPVDKAVALSLLVSAVVRGALGMVPVHAFTAPTPGSGKSYLADVTTAITSGRWCPVITPGRSEEELEKRLGAMLLAGYSTISLDNSSSELGGDALCQVAERPIVRIRILGKSEAPECEFRGLIVANGNNLIISGDMTRRVLLGKLDAGLERPEEREFRGNPVKQILQNRGAYAAAAITIVRAYIAAGQPGKLKPLASYEAWSDLVRSALLWLSCADPVETMAEARASDPVLTTLRTVLHAWRAVFGDVGQTTQEVASVLTTFDPNARGGDDLIALRAALAPIAGIRGIIDATKLSYWLRKSKGRPVDGLKFIGSTAHGGAQAWQVVSV